MNWPKYTRRIIHGLSFFFIRKVNDNITKEYEILFIKKLPSKLDEKNVFFHPKIPSEIIQRTIIIPNIL